MKRLLTLGLMTTTLLAVAMPAMAQRGEERGRGRGEWSGASRSGQSESGGRQGWSRPPSAVTPTQVPPSSAGRPDWNRQRDDRGLSGAARASNWPEGRRFTPQARDAAPSNVPSPPVERVERGRQAPWANNADNRRPEMNRDDRPRGTWSSDQARREDRRPDIGRDDRGRGNWSNDQARRDDRNQNGFRTGNDWSRQRNWNNDRRLHERERWADTRRWDNRWRNDRRYDWRDYRAHNRFIYRMPAYYAPFGWHRGYTRFSIGIFLSNVLFASNYWIDDPYHYRLPPAYGPLRWVRYYDDALLVDVRDGYVVDVIHDFFW